MTDQLTEALERFSRSLPVLGSLKGEWGGTTDDERADYAKDAWAIVKAAREHLSCSTITDEQVEAATRAWFKAVKYDGVPHEYDYRIVRIALEAAARVKGEKDV